MEQTKTEANVQNKGGKRLKEGSDRKLGLKLLGGALAVTAAAYLGLCAYAGALDTFYPNRNINGIAVGGMTAPEAQEVLEREFPARTVAFVSPEGERLTETTLAELGYTADLFAGDARFWLDQQQSDGFLNRGWSFLNTVTGRWPGGWNWPDPNGDVFDDRVEQLCDELHEEPLDGTYTLNADSITIRKARDGRTVDRHGLQANMRDILGTPDALIVTVPFTTTPAQGLSAQALHDQIAGEMKNAGYDPATDSITPEQLGAEFDAAAAQRLLDAAEPGETVEVPAQLQFPAVTAEQLRSVLFRDVLGQCRTHVGGTAARKTNVRLASAAFNNIVLNSGETFSYNETVGERTAAKGYQAAPAYVKGETVDEIGGGVCQPSSTLYYACLRADLEITERYAHRYVPSYIDWGMDATVSWNGPDYKFTNNTDYPVRIVTTYEGGYLTVQLLGTKTTDTTVKMTNKVLETTPWETEYQEDPAIAPGKEEVKVTPYTGYKVVTFQNYYDAAGKLISSHQEATSNYKVRNKLILKAPGELPGQEVPAAGGAVIPVVPPVTEPEPSMTEPETPAVEPEIPVTEPEAPVTEPVLPESGGGGTIVVEFDTPPAE